jgi:hypothetical protein
MKKFTKDVGDQSLNLKRNVGSYETMSLGGQATLIAYSQNETAEYAEQAESRKAVRNMVIRSLGDTRLPRHWKFQTFCNLDVSIDKAPVDRRLETSLGVTLTPFSRPNIWTLHVTPKAEALMLTQKDTRLG